ncbi:MAG: hypothetical protein DWQ09_13695 [Proteobacteria bacterium]|nr:MAG: hypothetical protein DWQ09_13695 [Pseudomonadota bacterium]QKK12433.1 MAG: hypothetical protein HND59_13435 [Pseudomonadota bacterium]
MAADRRRVDPVAVVIEREMAITWEDFQRILPTAAGQCPFTVGRRTAIVEFQPGEQFSVTLGPTRQRRIALLSLPATPTSIEYHGEQTARFKAFLERFDRYFQRGGG